MSEQIEKDRFAVLVDGDNATPSLLGHVLLEVAKYGRITIRRVYGDWTTPNMHRWKSSLHDHAMQPVQQFRYAKSKNATDSTMIIDGMDILHRRLVDGFCIMSSDSDFTRLATRIREDGLLVIGVGEGKTPNSFVKACDVFVWTENLGAEPPLIQEASEQPQPAAPAATAGKLKKLFRQAFAAASGTNDGWVTLSSLGEALRKVDPDFDHKTYNFPRLLDMVNEYPNMVEQKRDGGKSSPRVYVRLKRK